MKKGRSCSNRVVVEYAAHDLLDNPEDELEPVQIDWTLEPTYIDGGASDAELDELRSRLRTMAEQLESEAEQIRRQLRMLETTIGPNVYH
jgi:hypothetical protein